MHRFLPAALCAAGIVFTACGAETRDLILIAGQSNAVGADANGMELPADAADKEVMFWWRTGDPPPDEFDTTSGKTWTTLQPQPRGNPMPKERGVPRQWGNFAHASGFGPEIGLARALQARETKPLAIVKAAFSGTGMAKDWNHTDESDGPGGPCYRALVAETKAAIAAARAADITLRPRALVWVQGESDANAQDAPRYRLRLGAMIACLRLDLHAPDLIALVGVNTNFGNGKNVFMPTIVEQQKLLATPLARCAYVDTSGLTYANAAHFDTKSTIDIGRRFADALLALEAATK